MKRVVKLATKHRRRIVLYGLFFALLSSVMWYRLGTLVSGLSYRELSTLGIPVGWHGIYHHPFYLPLLLVRSVFFYLFSDYGDLLARLANTIFGIVGVVSFGYIIRRWHGVRTAVLATSMFATSAWALHSSRLASFDVMYLIAMPVMICTGLFMQKNATKWWAFYGSMLIWVSLLYTPGLVWLVFMTVYWQKETIADGWKYFNGIGQRFLYVFSALIWLPLLIVNLFRPHQLLLWLGAPVHLAAPLTVLKQFAAVFVHLFLRGPQYPDTWLARAPIMDVFTLVMCIFGIYFYIAHAKAFRSRQLLSYFVIGVILIGLNGPVALSLLVPLLYIVAATGIAYLLHEWLKVFPINPFARGVGITVLSLAVFLSCVYNLRAYFVAWPNNNVTQTVFRYHR